MKETFKKGPWFVEYDLNDGARIRKLSYKTLDLLTTKPNQFKVPFEDYGQYETRPVYGYDDCFPSVDVCKYPGCEWVVPDHGELCWLGWGIDIDHEHLLFSVESKVLPVLFTRTLSFGESTLNWKFEVQNTGDRKLPFQHVVHPLIKLSELIDIEFPEFRSVSDENGELLDFESARAFTEFLFSCEKGRARMLYLHDPKENLLQWKYKNGLKIRLSFPDQFNSIGVWWNNRGYPDEEGCRRDECAFEPIPGTTSKLTDAHEEGYSLWVEPGEVNSWMITWELEFE